MRGAPVATIDLDFLPRAPSNRNKLVCVAKALGATLYRQIFRASRVIRMMNDDETLQVDFMEEVSDVRSFEGVSQTRELSDGRENNSSRGGARRNH